LRDIFTKLLIVGFEILDQDSLWVILKLFNCVFFKFLYLFIHEIRNFLSKWGLCGFRLR
jgi:hypothetical protein